MFDESCVGEMRSPTECQAMVQGNEPAPTTYQLAQTGGDSVSWVALAFLLVALGLVLVAAARKAGLVR